jgi:WS/DGAT/MGAT family acyltransferase
MLSTPLDFSKPLWQFHLVEDYKGGSAIILRIHHCYADGIALIHVLLSMTDKSPSAFIDTSPRKHKLGVVDKSTDEVHGGIFKYLFEPIGGAVNSAVKTGRDFVEEGVEIVRHPYETIGYARQGAALASEAAKLALMPNDPQTRFKGQPGVAKCVAWAEPLSLMEVKAVGKVLGCSINDVLLSSVAGALRDYLVEKGDPVNNELAIRVTVPVNLRSLEKIENLGNVFGLVMLTLPIGIENPLERLEEVRKRMEELKSSYQATLALGLLGALGFGPKILQASVIRILTQKATAVMTNVPGPPQPLYFAGARIAEQMFWVPQTETIGMGVSILSYNEHVHFGLVTDKKLVGDPQTIVSRFAGEFEKLLLLTIMDP